MSTARKFVVGDHVSRSGYHGVVAAEYAPDVYEVRLIRGTVVVPGAELRRMIQARDLKPGDVIYLMEHHWPHTVTARDPHPEPANDEAHKGQIRVWLDTEHDSQRPFWYAPTDWVAVAS